VIEDHPTPEPKRGEAVLKVRAGGVGLTLLNMRSGRFGGKTPRIMGMNSAAILSPLEKASQTSGPAIA
jgi:NADPH:quinone reductase-like Zn-dependent oxidoreductase